MNLVFPLDEVFQRDNCDSYMHLDLYSVEEYRHSKKVAGVVEDSLYEAALTLRHFERLVGKCNSIV